MRAKDIMTKIVATVGPDHSIGHVVQIMLDHGISGLPVVGDDGRLVGIITEGDLLYRAEIGGSRLPPIDVPISPEQRARNYVKSHSWRVADVMTADVVAIEEETPVSRIAALMEEHGIKRLPVVRDGDLVGIVSRSNLLRAIVMTKPDDTAAGDDAICRSILARLKERTGLEDARLSINVSGGIAHLWGTVSSEGERDAARVVAEGVRGVAGVVNHLHISVREERLPNE